MEGDRKLMLRTRMVRQTDKVTSTRVKIKYRPSKGIPMDVGGKISESSRKKTTRVSIIDMLREI